MSCSATACQPLPVHLLSMTSRRSCEPQLTEQTSCWFLTCRPKAAVTEMHQTSRGTVLYITRSMVNALNSPWLTFASLTSCHDGLLGNAIPTS